MPLSVSTVAELSIRAFKWAKLDKGHPPSPKPRPLSGSARPPGCPPIGGLVFCMTRADLLHHSLLQHCANCMWQIIAASVASESDPPRLFAGHVTEPGVFGEPLVC